jgi:hypothetical protein
MYLENRDCGSRQQGKKLGRAHLSKLACYKPNYAEGSRSMLGNNIRFYQKKESKNDWVHGSSGRIFVSRGQGPEFKPNTTKKKEKKFGFRSGLCF